MRRLIMVGEGRRHCVELLLGLHSAGGHQRLLEVLLLLHLDVQLRSLELLCSDGVGMLLHRVPNVDSLLCGLLLLLY